VEYLLDDPNMVCYAHAVNLVEVYYDALRHGTSADARGVLATLRADGVINRRDMNEPFLRSVGALKVLGRLSLADCFCIALSQTLSADLYTSDHHEFDRLVPLRLCSIVFIR
jgi:hypothetical protein